MIPETGGPLTMSVTVTAVQIVTGTEIKPRQGIAAILPVYEIVRFQHGHSREYEHRGRYHVIGVTYPYDIGIRKISGNKRIGKSAVTIVTAGVLSQ